jgi:hypothetical protein
MWQKSIGSLYLLHGNGLHQLIDALEQAKKFKGNALEGRKRPIQDLAE